MGNGSWKSEGVAGGTGLDLGQNQLDFYASYLNNILRWIYSNQYFLNTTQMYGQTEVCGILAYHIRKMKRWSG